MNSIAFLIMLGVFACLDYWYIRNTQAGEDGGLGPLALKDDAGTDKHEEERTPLSGAAAIKAKVRAQTDSQADTEKPVEGNIGQAASADKSHKPKSYRMKED